MEVPRPRAAPGEVLVRLSAAAVNPMDWKIADGQLEGQLPYAFPLILGVDGAGQVDAVGEGVRGFAVGDSVYGQFFLVPVGSGGTFAEYVAVPEGSPMSVIERVPPGVAAADAAGAPTAGMAALGALDATGLSAGQTIVILGATGGIGSFAVQLAAGLGAHVIATGRPAQRDWLIQLGAAEACGRTADEITGQVRAARPDGVDVLLDLVGDRDLFDACTAIVREGGTALSLNFGAPAEPPATAKIRLVNYILMDGKQQLLERISGELAAGRLTVPAGRRLDLAAVPEALAASRAGSAQGKTLIRI
jgi:NADPH:quinone reductase-like Zn-dependent oxidoreductase